MLVDTTPDLRIAGARARRQARRRHRLHAQPRRSCDGARRGAAIQRACRSRRSRAMATSARLAICAASIPTSSSADTPRGGGVPQVVLVAHRWGSSASAPATFVPVPLMHGSRTILGYRVGSFAYLTDCSEHPRGVVAAAERRAHADSRCAARAAASHAPVADAGARCRRAARARARVLHAHVPRSAARRDLCAAACRRGVGI